jgi:tetratricopeptide (TPR) repeat protein
MAGTIQMIPKVDSQLLFQAKVSYEEALQILQRLASPVEVAEVKMNLGLVLQLLAPYNLARVVDSIRFYQEALQVFIWQKYPQEYAILHNNIAIAYLSMPIAGENENLSNKHQELAVESLETALKQINLVDHPREYAMLQNNLGNTWQYLPNSSTLEHNLQAINAYNRALKVRNPRDTPLEYAVTISNKANALYNLSKYSEGLELGNQQNLLKVRNYYQEAWQIFTEHEQLEQGSIIAQAIQDVEREIQLENSENARNSS